MHLFYTCSCNNVIEELAYESFQNDFVNAQHEYKLVFGGQVQYTRVFISIQTYKILEARLQALNTFINSLKRFS